MRSVTSLHANLLTEIGHEVQVGSHLQLITGEQFPWASSSVNDGTCLDINFCKWFLGRQLIVRELSLMRSRFDAPCKQLFYNLQSNLQTSR